jgi:outer membrane protein OmpA-like peptidoglycan-associated protein
MYRESEFELAARELEYQLAAVARPRVRIIYGRKSNRELEFEFEFEAFDPSPPAPGTAVISGFPLNGAQLNSTQRNSIDRMASTIVAAMPRQQSMFIVVIDVEGHEDETGDPGRFGGLGLQRAVAVARHLGERIQARGRRIPLADRRNVEIQVTSAGPTRPIRSNVTAAGRSQNRRVEIRFRFENRTI